MGLIGTVLGSASTAVSGFSIGTWIKIGAVVAVALAFAGLYAWGKYEQNAHNAAEKQIGQYEVQLTNAQAQIKADGVAIANWKAAVSQYQNTVSKWQDAAQSAQAEKERLDETLKHLDALLRGNPTVAARRLNRNLDELICMFNRATGGTGNCAVAAPGAHKVAKAKAAHP